MTKNILYKKSSKILECLLPHQQVRKDWNMNNPVQADRRSAGKITHPSVNQPRSGLNYYVVLNFGVASFAPRGASLARGYSH